MKVAMFTETYLPYINGVVTHIRLLKEGLEELGHEVLIVTADPTVRHHRVENGVLRCPAHSFKKIYGYGVALPLSSRRLRYLIRFKPDIIHIHNEFGVGLFGLQSASILGLPVVYTIHTIYDDYLHYIGPSGMTNVLNKTMTFYLNRFTKNACAITGPSAKVEDFCKRHHLEAKVFIISNCPDLKAFNPSAMDAKAVGRLRKKFNIHPKDKVLITVCRIAPEKSMDVLINYFFKCFSADKDYKMIMVGDGPALASLKEQTRLFNLEDRILFPGAVPNTEVPDYCHMADLFTSASLSDTYSISMLEAMAAGLPAVIRLDEINKGQIRHGVNGFIFRNEVEFENNIRSYFALPPEERNAMKAGTIASISSYGKKELAGELLKVYQHAKEVYLVRHPSKIRARVSKLILKQKS